MTAIRGKLRKAAASLSVAWILALAWPAPTLSADCSRSLESLVRLAADRIDGVFRDVAASTRALGEESGRRLRHPSPVTDTDKAAWLGRAMTRGNTTAFQTWPEGVPIPAFQAPFPGFYAYRSEVLTNDQVARLQAFARLVPVFRAAYRSLDLSWVYLTTADDMMLIYPYVPLDEAVNNDRPTAQAFYTAADFERRSVGWTRPYLDLVGAGMMITASYPVFDGVRLLGVASRDMTLKELSRSVLKHLVRRGDTVAFIVDRRGLAIEAGDAELAIELESVNTAKKGAVLYYRTATGLAAQADPKAVASRFEWVNAVTERVLAAAAKSGASDPIALEMDGRRVQAARIDTTGWLVILVVGKA